MRNLHPCHKSVSNAAELRNVARHHTDSTLIQRVLNGDTNASREFEERYRSLIYAILHTYHILDQDQDDIYHEVYVRLWAQNMRRLRLWTTTGMNQFSFYLTAIVRNLIIDWHRKRIPAPLSVESVNPVEDTGWNAGFCTPYSAGEMSVDFDGHLLRAERVNALREAIGSLRDRDVDLIRRRYYVEQSYQEIAQALGMSVNNVGVALSNARMRLGRRLCRLQPDLFVTEPSGRIQRRKQNHAA